ncbi:rRNA maturation RNase YbeY [Chloroflexota bacterium]
MIIDTMEVNVLIDEGFEGCVEASWLERMAEKVLEEQGADSRVELSLVIASQEKVRRLNLSYLEEDDPTDVLSFSMLSEQPGGDSGSFVAPPDGVQHLGEVIISYPQAVIQAEEHRHSVKREIAILIIHGTLHLLGYDHDNPEMEREMRTQEAKILNYIKGELE